MNDSILIFGGSQLQVSILNQAKQLGFRTIVIDPDENAPARVHADLFFQVGRQDVDRTLELATQYEVKGVITAATDHPILMMARIASSLSLPFPSFQSCETLLDKAKFKCFLETWDIPHARGRAYQKNEKVDPLMLKYPVITKPVRNSGSRGVIRCDAPGNLMATIRETQQFCGDGRYIIEEFIEGDEISVEGIVQNHTVEIIQLTDKMVTDPPYNVELGHIQPSRYEYLKEKIRSVLQKVVTDSGLNDCAIHPELKIKDDEITIIEIGPRLGGDFITSHLVPLSTGINMEELVIKIATGTPFTLTMKEMAAMVSYLNFETGCKVTNILSLNNIRETFGHVVDYQFTLRIGESIPLITNSLNRYGHFIVQSAKADGLISLAKEINSFIFDRVCEC